MTNPEIADDFDQIADILEFQGANQFRVRAYRNAARTIRDLPESAAEIASDSNRKLTDIEGIGKDLADKIAAIVATGTLEQLETLKKEVPQSVLAMMRVPGLGPKRAAMIFKELKVTTLDELRQACEAPQDPRSQGIRRQDRGIDPCRHCFRRRGGQAHALGRSRRFGAGSLGSYAAVPGRRPNRTRRQLPSRNATRWEISTFFRTATRKW